MIRVLIVAENDIELDLDAFKRDFSGIHLLVIRETQHSFRLLCQHNPHIVVSIGEVSSESFLWLMPLWRRLRWLNLPDTRLGSEAVRFLAKSLLAGTCDQNLGINVPLISAVPTSTTPADIAKSIIQINRSQIYDNFEFIIENLYFDEVLHALGDNPVLSNIVKVPTASSQHLINRMRNASIYSKGHFLWPIFSDSFRLPHDAMESVGKAMTIDSNEAIIMGKNVSGEAILDDFQQRIAPKISNLFIRPQNLVRASRFDRDFQLESLSGLLLELLATSSFSVHNLTETLADSPVEWWTENDEHLRDLLDANVRYVSQLPQYKN